jgi:hypothetical protein
VSRSLVAYHTPLLIYGRSRLASNTDKVDVGAYVYEFVCVCVYLCVYVCRCGSVSACVCV